MAETNAGALLSGVNAGGAQERAEECKDGEPHCEDADEAGERWLVCSELYCRAVGLPLYLLAGLLAGPARRAGLRLIPS